MESLRDVDYAPDEVWEHEHGHECERCWGTGRVRAVKRFGNLALPGVSQVCPDCEGEG